MIIIANILKKYLHFGKLWYNVFNMIFHYPRQGSSPSQKDPCFNIKEPWITPGSLIVVCVH